MIDERTLTDATRCPSCAGPVLGSETCRTCGVDLTGPTARSVWQLSVQAAGVLAERTRLIGLLRVEVAPSRSAADPAMAAGTPAGVAVGSSAAGSSAAGSLSAPAAGPGGPPLPLTPPLRVSPPARPAPEWTKRKVQNLLLSLGVALLAVAAVIFLVVSWSVLGIGGRAAVMAGCTALAGGGAAFAHRRGLGSTAEAVSVLTVGLALLDAVGARAAGLAGLDDIDRLAYWAGALAVVAALAAATAVVVPTRSLRVSAAVLGLLSAPMLTAYLADGSDHPAAVAAGGLTLAGVAALALAAGWPLSTRSHDARVVVAGGGALGWLAACCAALLAAYGEGGSLVPGTVLLLVLAAVAASTVRAGDRLPALPALATVGVTTSAALVVAAAWSVPFDVLAGPSDGLGARWLPVLLSGIAVALLAAAIAVPRVHRRGPVLIALLASVAPGLVAAAPAGDVLSGQLAWLEHPWQGTAAESAREMVAYIGESHVWGTEIPVLLGCVALALIVADRLHGLRPAAVAALPLVAVAVGTLTIAQDLAFPLALGIDLAVAVALVLPGAWLLGRGHLVWGGAAMATGVAGLAVTAAWSFALPSATIAALGTAAALLAGATVLLGARASLAPLRLSLGVAAAVAGVGEAAAIARAGGAGWPAVWSLALALCAVAAGAAAVLVKDAAVRRAFVVAATVPVLGDVAALTVWGGGGPAGTGLAVAVTASVLVATAVWVDTLVTTTARTTSQVLAAVRADVGVTAAVTAAVGIAFSAVDPERLWLALLAAGVCAGFVSLRSGLHQAGWAAGALLAASSWVRLVLSDVSAPEPYTVPAGVALVVFGAWRRRQDPMYSSWRAYGTGLCLAMGPSLVRAVGDPGNLRPMLLGLAAVLVLFSGIAGRLKAPLAVGGTVLAVDAFVQLSPYLVAFYTAVPRWSLIAGTGLLLLVVGMTYERRAHELQALHQQISRFN